MKTYAMHNFKSEKHVTKTQKTEPKMKGFVCVAAERVLPETNSRGERLFAAANNRPYYAAVMDDGSHYQP